MGSFEALLNHIPTGEANAIHQAELAQELGIDRTTLKDEIRAARRSGYQIASGIRGYWRPASEADMIRYARMMRKQAAARYRTVEGIPESGQEAGKVGEQE